MNLQLTKKDISHIILVVIILLLTLSLIILDSKFSHKKIVEAPLDLRIEAVRRAWKLIGTEYLFGGPDTNGFDCSGLIIEAYSSAVEGSAYSLPFSDVSVQVLKMDFSVPLEKASIGDLLFIGEKEITHVGLIDRIEEDQIYFIDAYQTSGFIELRTYATDNPCIQGIGRLLLRKEY
ncbi:MAG: C40 family peptidase [Spirochaetales bacterium]|jgi:hypothetical protein|nr:C40 family peptidase [Spirochaetales bacterium]